MIVTSRCSIDAGDLGRLPGKEGATLGFGNMKREAVIGDDGVLGFTEEYTDAPFIKVTLVDSVQSDKDKLVKFVGENVLLSTNNGQQYTLTNAWVGNVLELNIKDGKMDVEFYGFELIPQ